MRVEVLMRDCARAKAAEDAALLAVRLADTDEGEREAHEAYRAANAARRRCQRLIAAQAMEV